jgi:hypothetical protein
LLRFEGGISAQNQKRWNQQGKEQKKTFSHR